MSCLTYAINFVSTTLQRKQTIGMRRTKTLTFLLCHRTSFCFSSHSQHPFERFPQPM